MFPKVQQILLVCYNLSTRTMGALYATVLIEKKCQLVRKIETRHMPEYGSALMSWNSQFSQDSD